MQGVTEGDLIISILLNKRNAGLVTSVYLRFDLMTGFQVFNCKLINHAFKSGLRLTLFMTFD